MLGHGFDANGNLAGAEVDGNDAPGFGEGEERIGHQILRIAWREITRQCPEETQLFPFRDVSASHRDNPPSDVQRRGRPAYGMGVCRLAGSTVPAPGSEVEVLAPRSAQAFRSSSA